jgi:GAF domain-containing protein
MQRLEALRALASFEATALPALTALARVTAQLTGASAAAVHLFDDDVQHRVAAVGAPLVTHPAADSLCIRVIEGERRIVCTDATLDPRLAYSSFVQGPDPVRFYASVPISSGGQVVGTLCAWDGVARELPDAAVNALEDLAIQVETQLRLLELASALGDAASRDPLTGVANRTIFDDRLAQALARRARRGARRGRFQGVQRRARTSVRRPDPPVAGRAVAGRGPGRGHRGADRR